MHGLIFPEDKGCGHTGPLIVTNAHVVTDADNVMIQIPAYGSQEYKVRACSSEDCAAVAGRASSALARFYKGFTRYNDN